VGAFERSAAKQPANAGYLYHLGLAHTKNGDNAKARETLEKALATKGDFKDAAETWKVLANPG
jgi:uncharacterized protein HemY